MLPHMLFLLYSYAVWLALFFFSTSLPHVDPIFTFFLHVQITTSKSLEFLPRFLLFKVNLQLPAFKILLWFFFKFIFLSASLLCMKLLLLLLSLIGSKKSGGPAHYAHCLNIVELFLYFFFPKLWKAHHSCWKEVRCNGSFTHIFNMNLHKLRLIIGLQFSWRYSLILIEGRLVCQCNQLATITFVLITTHSKLLISVY